MKKVCILLSIIGLLAMFTSCKSATDDDSPLKAFSTSSEASASNVQYTEDDIIRYFKNFSDSQNCVVTDCVLAQDNAYGLIGIVQYTDENGNPCNLSFVKDTSFGQPVGLDADGLMKIADDSALNYVGNGIVTLTLYENEKNQRYDYTVEYSYSEKDNATHFVISSEKK